MPLRSAEQGNDDSIATVASVPGGTMRHERLSAPTNHRGCEVTLLLYWVPVEDVDGAWEDGPWFVHSGWVGRFGRQVD